MIFQRDPSSPERDRRLASVAVAPFDPEPLTPEEARVARGFLEDVIAELSRLPDIEVLAARTSLSLGPDELEPRRMAEAYGVTHVLDSSVRPTVLGVQVKVNLVESASGRAIWAERYEATSSAGTGATRRRRRPKTTACRSSTSTAPRRWTRWIPSSR